MSKFFFGLNVNRNLTDIVDPIQALKNINLDIKDLDRIRGVTDPGGVDRTDFLSLSGITQDLEKVLESLRAETSNYNILLSNIYDESSLVDSNVVVNGQIAAKSIKYLYLDSDNTIKTADISTSRVSSWSSFETPITQNTTISYGGEIELEGPLELSELILNQNVENRRFESEIPTHIIKTTVDGSDVYLYAMKGIPLKFRGFFRNATLTATINQLSGIRPSWLIVNIANNNEIPFENRLVGSTSQIQFSDTAARERDINFYYPVNRINSLTLTSIALTELPSVVLNNLQSFNISNNDLREFPNLSEFTSLTTLNIANNDLTRSSNINLRFFNSNILSRLPLTLQNLTVGNCFSGQLTIDLSSLPLRILDINAGTRINRRLSGIAPKVNGATIQTYNVEWNLFTNIDSSVKQSTSLRRVTLDHNNFTNSDMSFVSDDLEFFSSDGNRHNLVNVAGKTKLTYYLFRSFRSLLPGNSEVTNIFNNCSSLQTIILEGTPVTGNLPSFLGCLQLQTVNFLNTNVTEAISSGQNQPAFVIGENTFDSCRDTLRSFRVRSSEFSQGPTFHPDCFRLMPSLDWLEISSNNRGISGELPSFATARNIRYILLYSNKLEGPIPNFVNNERLFFLNLTNNLFSGNVPNIPATTFQHLILTNNRLTQFQSLQSTNIRRIHLGWNNITNIPNLSNLTLLQELLLNNQRLFGNQMNYTAGSFSGTVSLRTLNISNNSINQGFINQIILDLSENYDQNPRTGVVINLRGNSSPSNSEEVQGSIDKLRSGGWNVLVD